jgi:mRNA-degrading endonuclease RelE of RelBE toxin-antitoxin system
MNTHYELIFHRRARAVLERLAQSEQEQVNLALHKFMRLGFESSEVRRIDSSSNMYLLRISTHLRAILTVSDGTIIVLDIVTHERLSSMFGKQLMDSSRA